MAVLIQKIWNDTAGVVSEGVEVRFSSNGFYLYVLNAKGLKNKRITLIEVKKSWQTY
jgi:hypothetical protein